MRIINSGREGLGGEITDLVEGNAGVERLQI